MTPKDRVLWNEAEGVPVNPDGDNQKAPEEKEKCQVKWVRR